MSVPRRGVLGSTLVVLGSAVLDALTSPLWRWRRSLLTAATGPGSPAASPGMFVDGASEAGLTIPNVWGGPEHKRSIIEAKGSGTPFFDSANDGWLDSYLTNGTRPDPNPPPGTLPTPP